MARGHTIAKPREDVVVVLVDPELAADGAFGRPRNGVGVRNGASVSTRMRSRGVTASASRRFCAFLNVTLPAKLSQ